MNSNKNSILNWIRKWLKCLLKIKKKLKIFWSISMKITEISNSLKIMAIKILKKAKISRFNFKIQHYQTVWITKGLCWSSSRIIPELLSLPLFSRIEMKISQKLKETVIFSTTSLLKAYVTTLVKKLDLTLFKQNKWSSRF